MADQKTEDTKSPLQRRGARPFAGPAAARPFLRPVTTPQRATAAPFVPPVVPGKPALGRPAPSANALTPAAAGTVPQAVSQPVPPSDADAVPPTRPMTSEMIALDAFDAFDTVWGTTEAPLAPEPRATAAPLDELSLGSGTDAGEVWAGEITATAGDVVAAELEAPPAPAADPTYSTPSSAMPAWLEDDGALVPPATAGSVVVPVASAPALDAPDAPPSWPVAENDATYSFTEWTDAHGIPTADELEPASTDWSESPTSPTSLVSPDAPHGGSPEPSLGDASPGVPGVSPEVAEEPLAEGSAAVSQERPRFELVRESQETEAVQDLTPETSAPRTTRDMQCAAALNRLADRIRSGEIDVSSIAPDAPDAAILASVLAALLGGSSSR